MEINLSIKELERNIKFCEDNMELFTNQLKEQQQKGMSLRSQEISKIAYHRWLGQYDIWNKILLISR